MENGTSVRNIDCRNSYTDDSFCLGLMEESFKRINKETGKPFKPGFKDDSGRIFLRYLNKHGNDGYYLEEWKKDMESFLKKAKELDINFD